MTGHATRETVEVALRRDLDPESEAKFVDPLLKRVQALLYVRIPDLDERMENEHFAELVRGVEADALARVFRSPNNGIYRRENEGDYNYELNMQVASGVLDVQPKEWEKLGVGGRFGVVDTVSDRYATERTTCYPQYAFQGCFPAYGQHGHDNFTGGGGAHG